MSDFEFPKAEKDDAQEAFEATAEKVSQIQTNTPKYEDAELEAVFDALMFEGRYTEEVKVGKRVKVVFQSRNGKESSDVTRRLDKMGLNMGLTVESFRALLNLTYSLQVINGRDISGETFEKKIDIVEALPAAVLNSLIGKLVTFEMKIEAAVRHGEENF